MKRFISLLLTVILFELMLGGGGRLTAWGSVSLRMILFGVALFIAGIQIFRKQKIPVEYWFISILFGIMLIIGLVRGIAMGASRAYWWEDVKPLLYFFILPFFGYAIRERSTVEQIVSIIKQSGIILSCAFIFVLILVHTSVIPFLDFGNTVIGTQEFFFRGEITFFYKGFIYICIAFLFIHLTGHRYKHFMLILLAVGILLSVTRGFIFAIALTYGSYYLLKSSFTRSVIFVALSILIVVIGQVVITQSSKALDHLKNQQQNVHPEEITPNPNLFGNKSYSDEGRFQQLKEVAGQTNLSSVFIGHGFGNGIPSRPIHMEISYLEIFHKQGLLGLLFWTYLLWLLYQKYRKATPGGMRDAFFFGSLFIYFQSITNQYLNNPIGLSLVLLSLVCLDQLKKEDRE